MRAKTKTILAAAAMTAVVIAPAVARAGNDSQGTAERDSPITGADLERASRTAIAHLGGGRVTGTEIEDEESYYEVEVTLENGGQVDVQLDEEFNVVGTEDDASGHDD